jgi:hypothetical protein
MASHHEDSCPRCAGRLIPVQVQSRYRLIKQDKPTLWSGWRNGPATRFHGDLVEWEERQLYTLDFSNREER